MKHACSSYRIFTCSSRLFAASITLLCSGFNLSAQNAATTLAPPSVIFEALALNHDIPTKKKPKYRSPTALVPSPDGKKMYIAEQTAKRIAVYNLEMKSLEDPILLPNEVTGIALSTDGNILYATCGSEIWPKGMICVIDVASCKVTNRISEGIGFMPRSPVLSPDGSKLYVCNRFSNSLSVINTSANSVTKTVPMIREPYASAITPDGKRLIIGNMLSRDRATDSEFVSCEVTFYDTETDITLKSIRLPSGCKQIHGIAVSPDGSHAFASHLSSPFTLLMSSVVGGWGHTNCIAVLDIDSLLLVNTISLDYANLGIANPWEVRFATEGFPEDSIFMLISHAGGSSLSMIRYKPFIEKIDSATTEGIFLGNKFTYLLEDVRYVASTGFSGTRALAVIDRNVFTAGYFDDENPVMGEYRIGLRDTGIGIGYPEPVYHSIGNQLPVTSERLGERNFYNAENCMQNWHTCHSCHPFGRTDGFNRILNSAIAGYPKNTKSTLYAWWTPRCSWTGQRENAQMAIMAAIQLKLLMTPKESVTLPLDTFFMGMKPASSPYLEKGLLSAAAQRGKILFNDTQKGGCSSCHQGPLFSEEKTHPLFTPDPSGFDINTPSLVECWRTAPYGHMGEYTDIREIIGIDAHTGLQQKIADGTLTYAQIDDLVAYVLSL